MSKWFLEIVQDFDKKYYANLFIEGKKVEGLPESVDYNTLRDSIKQNTGIEILKKKDMFFQTNEGKKYAYLDNTHERNDCRVTLAEIYAGWGPKFDLPGKCGETVYIPPKGSHVLDLDSAAILEGRVLDRQPASYAEGWPRAATIIIQLQNEIFEDGSKKSLDRIWKYYDSESLYETSLDEAKERAKEVYEKIREIKSLPMRKEPTGSYGSDYFEVIDFKALSDEQLVTAKDLANCFVGPQSLAVSTIHKEMQNRFEKGVTESAKEKPSLTSLMAGAKGKQEKGLKKSGNRLTGSCVFKSLL